MTDPQPRFRHLTPELLASLSADEIADAVVQHVQLRTAAEWGRGARVLAALPRGVRAVYVTWLVDRAVNAGGFASFFAEEGERYAGDALAGYELLDAEEYAAVMRAAIAAQEIDRERGADFREIDQRYYALGDRIYTAWAVTVRDRPELLLGDE